VRIIARRIIDDFEVDLPDSPKSRVLVQTIDIKNDQANASIFANNRVVFNFKRNDYRAVNSLIIVEGFICGRIYSPWHSPHS
jgi:5-deoxy-D-glucuronate isomerase